MVHSGDYSRKCPFAIAHLWTEVSSKHYRKLPLTSPPPLPPDIGLSTCRRKKTSNYKPPHPSPPLACTEMNSLYYDVKLMPDIFWSALLLLVCTWRHGGHVGAQEHKHFFSLWTKSYFHVNSSRKNLCCFDPNTAALSRGCRPRMACLELVFYFGYKLPRLYKSLSL